MTSQTRPWTAALVAGAALTTIALAALTACNGCGPSDGHPAGASPIVRPDSEEGKKAIAETEELLKLRAAQEAKSRKRLKKSPEPE